MSGIDPLAERERRRLLAVVFGHQAPPGPAQGNLLRSSEVAELFQVSSRTVGNWARRGVIPSVITPGGHRRYPAAQIYQLAADTIGFLPPFEDWHVPEGSSD